MRKLYTGPFGAHRRQQWVEKAVRLLHEEEGDRFLFILPTSALLKEVRQEIMEKTGGYATIHLLTFDEIAQKVIEAQGYSVAIISPYTRYRFFGQLLERVQDHDLLDEFRDTWSLRGVKRSLLHMMDELKRSGFSIDDARRVVEKKHTDRRTRALAYLYEQLEHAWQERFHQGIRVDKEVPSHKEELLHMDVRLLGESSVQAGDRLRNETVVYMTPEDRLQFAARLLNEGIIPSWLQTIHTLWVDHFTDFQPLQFQVLKPLVQQSTMEEIGIYLPYEEDVYADLPHLRSLVQQTMHQLQQLGLEHEHIVSSSSLFADHSGWLLSRKTAGRKQDGGKLGVTRPAVTEPDGESDVAQSTADPDGTDPEVAEQEQQVCHKLSHKLSQHMHVIPCASEQKEVAIVAKQIKQSLLERADRQPQDFVIVARNLSHYQHVLQETFAKEQIPLQFNEERPLLQAPLVEQVFAFLRLKSNQWHRDDVMKVAEGAYISWEVPPPAGLVRWMKGKGIVSGTSAWKEAAKQDEQRWRQKWKEMLQDEGQSVEERNQAQRRIGEEMTRMKQIKAWFEEVDNRLQSLPHRAPTAEFLSSIKAWLEQQGIKAVLQKNVGSPYYSRSLFKRDMQSLLHLEKSLHTLRQVAEHIGQTRRSVPLTVLVQEWQELLQEETLLLKKGDPEGVRCTEPSAARGRHFKEVYIVGLNEGHFPQTHRENWLLGDGDRLILQQDGTLPASHFHNEMEVIFMWMALSLPTERLTLTYVSPDVVEQALRSDFLEILLNKMPNGWWQKNVAAQQEQWPEALTQQVSATESERLSSAHEYRLWLMKEGKRSKASHIHEDHHVHTAAGQEVKGEPAHLWRAEWFPPDLFQHVVRGIEMEHVRQFSPYSEWDGNLQGTQAGQEVAALYSWQRPYSVSQINEYMSSPLTFFFQRVLGVRPIEELEAEVSPLAKGHLLHEVLRRFYEKYRGQRLQEEQLAQYEAELRHIFDEEAQSYAAGTIYEHSVLWKLETGRLKKELCAWLKQEVQQKRGGDLRPTYLELSFGPTFAEDEEVDPASQKDFLRVHLGQQQLKLYGKIDRIDMDDIGNFLLYDYKLSTSRYGHYKRLNDDTLNYQIPLYLAAVQQWLQLSAGVEQPQIVGGTFYSLRKQDKFDKVGMWNKEKRSMSGLSSRAKKGVCESIDEAVAEDLLEVAQGLERLHQGQFYLSLQHKPNLYYADNALFRYDDIHMRRKQQRMEEHKQMKEQKREVDGE